MDDLDERLVKHLLHTGVNVKNSLGLCGSWVPGHKKARRFRLQCSRDLGITANQRRTELIARMLFAFPRADVFLSWFFLSSGLPS